MKSLPPTAVANLKLRRQDLIDQIIFDAKSENKKLIDEAENNLKVTTKAFVDAVNKKAMEIAKPAIEAIGKVGKGTREFQSKFSFNADYHGNYRYRYGTGGEINYETVPPEFEVQIYNGYNGGVTFPVFIRMTVEMQKLQEKALEAGAALRKARDLAQRSMSEIRGDATRKIIRQAIAELPDGERLLETLRDIRKRVETSTGKPLLLPEAES